jgi:hypothetical protein
MMPIRDWLRRLQGLVDEGETGPFPSPGCVSRLEWVAALISLVIIVAFAITGNTVGVVATIGIVLVGVLLLVLAGGQRG